MMILLICIQVLLLQHSVLDLRLPRKFLSTLQFYTACAIYHRATCNHSPLVSRYWISHWDNCIYGNILPPKQAFPDVHTGFLVS